MTPEPSETRILRALGVPHESGIEAIEERGVREAIRLAADRALGMRAFEGVFRTAKVSVEPGALRIEGASAELASTTLARRFAEAKEVVLYAVTLGETWDEALDELARRGEPAEAWFLDAIGTHLVDRAARIVEEQASRDFLDWASPGLAGTGRDTGIFRSKRKPRSARSSIPPGSASPRTNR